MKFRVFAVVLTAIAVLAPSAGAAAPGALDGSEVGEVFRSLNENAGRDPVAADGLKRYLRLSTQERANLEAYATSDQFAADVMSAMSRTDSEPPAASGRSTTKVGKLQVDTTVNVSEQPAARLAAATSGESTSLPGNTTLRTWYVSVRYEQRMSLAGVPVLWYNHRLHYNHNGNSVTGTRGCEAWVNGFTGGWTLTPYPSHYRSGGVGFCKTRWHWKAPVVSLNYTFRMGVNAYAQVVLREWT